MFSTEPIKIVPEVTEVVSPELPINGRISYGSNDELDLNDWNVGLLLMESNENIDIEALNSQV